MSVASPAWQTMNPSGLVGNPVPTAMPTHYRQRMDDPSSLARMRSVASSTSFINSHLPAAALSRQLTTRSSVATLHRLRSKHLSAVARIRRFFHRLSWRQRVKGYNYGKAYLQRDPSFVITPDRSSYNYSYKNKDLVKRKPKPRFWRTAQPVAAWKNSKPMDVLQNNGQVDLSDLRAAETGSVRVPERSAARNQRERARRSSGAGRPNQPQDRQRQQSPLPRTFEPPPSTPSGAKVPIVSRVPNSRGSKDDQSVHQQYAKISLPVKHRHTKSEGFAATKAESNLDPSPHSTESSGGSRRSAPLEAMTHTPIIGSNRASVFDKVSGDSGDMNASPRGGKGGGGGSSSKKSERGSILMAATDPSRALSNAPRPKSAFVSGRASAYTTSDEDKTRSPTAAPSSYRPESWRRSAIIVRSNVDDMAEEAALIDLEDNGEFVGTWSRYLRSAIAARALHSRERKSWELEKEKRWSQNLGWETDLESSSAASSASLVPSSKSGGPSPSSPSSSSSSFAQQSDGNNTSSSPGTHDNSSIHTSLSSSDLSGPGEPGGPGAGAGASPSTPRRALQSSSDSSFDAKKISSSQAQAITGKLEHSTTYEPASPSSAKVTSKLAPLYSPRQMASASVTALALSSQPALNRESLEIIPSRYTSLFAMKQSNWQPEGSISSMSDLGSPNTSSSRLNEDEEDYIFPGQHGREKEERKQQLSNRAIHHHDASFSSSEEGTRHPRDVDFDFNDMTPTSRKRALPESPLRTPEQSTTAVTSGITSDITSGIYPQGPSNDLASTSSVALKSATIGQHQLMSAISLDCTQPVEGAPALVRSQSQWQKRNHQPKRVRSSTSKEHILHTRQKTMESLWAGEDDSDEGVA